MGLLSSEIPTKYMVPLCRQMATSYEAGIPIIRTLDLVGSQQGFKPAREVTTRMREAIERGGTLGQAARAESKYLPRFFIELLSSGEQGGRLDVMLRDLAQYYEDRLKMQRQILRTMIYPIVQVMFAWYLGTFALKLISAVMATFSGRGGNSFDFGTFLSEYAWFQGRAHIFFLIVFAVIVVLARVGVWQWIRGAVTTFIWPLAPVTKKFALARFFRSMSLLLGAGMRVDHCIEASAAVTANPYIQKDLVQAIPRVRDGQTLVESFAGVRSLTPTSREMLMVGETSGQLELQLRKLSQLHLEEATHAVNIATRVVSVLIGIAVAVLIGSIIIYFYMQLYGGLFNELGI